MTKNELEQMIYDYRWQSREAQRIKCLLSHIESPNGVTTTQYGEEATLPKANTSIKSKSEINAMSKREERLYRRYLRYTENTQYVESLANHLTNDIQLIVLDCMMEGMSYRSIASHIGTSRYKIGEIKEELLSQLCQKCHN